MAPEDEFGGGADYGGKTDASKSILGLLDVDKSDLKGTKESEKTTAELNITQAEADLKAETTNLENELAELEKLKPVCVDSGATHAERTARREQEIEALKEALKILEETDFGF